MDPELIKALLAGQGVGGPSPSQLFGMATQPPAPGAMAASPLAPKVAPTPQPAPAPQQSAPQSLAGSLMGVVAPPKAPEKFTAKLSDGTTVTGANAQAWLQDHQQNPNAKEVLELNVKGKQAHNLAQWGNDNPAPQEKTLDGGAMPHLQQTPTPQMQHAHLNPLAVALGIAQLAGGNYGNPAGAISQSIEGAIQQTHENFASNMQQAEFAANQAAQQYHAQMEQRDQSLREQGANNATEFANASNAYKDRKNAAGLTIEANAETGPDGLSNGLTKIGQLEADRQAAANTFTQAQAEPQRYLSQLNEAAGTADKVATAQLTGSKVDTENALRGPKVAGAVADANAAQGRAMQSLATAKKTVQDIQFGQDLHGYDIKKAAATLASMGKDLAVKDSQIGLNNANAYKARAGAQKDLAAAANGGIDVGDLAKLNTMNDSWLKSAQSAHDKAATDLENAQHQLAAFRQKIGFSTQKGAANGYQKMDFTTLQANLSRAQDAYNQATSVYQGVQKQYTARQQKILQRANGAVPGFGSGVTIEPGGKPLDTATAQQILQEAGGDANKARALATQRGYTF